MRVCLLNRFFDFRGTGVTRIATEVTKELRSQGHEVVQVSTNATSLYAYAWKTAIGVPLSLPRKGIDVYHALATLEAIWLPKSRSIATFLDLFTTTNPERAGAGMGYSRWKLAVGRWYFKVGSHIAAKCRYLVCISEKTKQDVLEHVCQDESRISVIRLGIGDDLKPMDGKPNGRVRIGALGQLDKRKRIDLLIRQFRASKIDAELVIAGVGPDREMLERIAGGDERIRFLGLIPEGALTAFYNSLDLFVFPTFIEGFGLPAVEAMACGKPVVVRSDSIIPDEIRTRCFAMDNLTELFDNENKLDTVLRTTDYEGNLEFAKEHRWDKCVAQYVELYKKIMEDS